MNRILTGSYVVIKSIKKEISHPLPRICKIVYLAFGARVKTMSNVRGGAEVNCKNKQTNKQT